MKRIRFLWILLLVLIIVLFITPKKKDIILPDGIYENCYLLSLENGEMTVIVDGEKKKIPCSVREKEGTKDEIIDIQIETNRIKKIVWKEGMITDKVEAVSLTEGWMNLAFHGRKKINENGELYIKTGDEVRLLSTAGSLLNRDCVSFYIYDNEICAAIVEGDENIERIKVLLHGEIEGVYHEKVRLTATNDYRVSIDGNQEEHKAGEEISFTKDIGQAKVSCEDGKIKILSIERASGYPEYRGEIIVRSDEEGYLLCNEISLEEYLYSVVSSEMPASYPEEALKTQAVCARTYAIYQMQQAYYGEYGAHVDDTVNSQVYNNVAETETTKKAVDATRGQYLSYEGKPICAYFYSTSCGMTSDVKDVWISEGTSPVYLAGKFQGDNVEKEDNTFGDLEQNEVFYQFITDIPDRAFEKEEPWFRWSGRITYDDLSNHVEQHLKEWIKENPSYYNLESDRELLGNIIKVQVEKRSKGGVIKRLSLTGEYGILTVTGEYQIRKALCPEKLELTLNDGTKKSCSMLPSGYFAIENGESIVLYGGGYGHGVGMSQNGAKAMAQRDYTYENILKFYYPETDLVEAY